MSRVLGTLSFDWIPSKNFPRRLSRCFVENRTFCNSWRQQLRNRNQSNHECSILLTYLQKKKSIFLSYWTHINDAWYKFIDFTPSYYEDIQFLFFMQELNFRFPSNWVCAHNVLVVIVKGQSLRRAIHIQTEGMCRLDLIGGGSVISAVAKIWSTGWNLSSRFKYLPLQRALKSRNMASAKYCTSICSVLLRNFARGNIVPKFMRTVRYCRHVS